MSFPHDLRAVVTGGGSGLGRALALELAARGGRVVVADINEAAANETAKLVTDAGATAFAQVCDVRDPAAVEALADAADTYFGGSDLIVNNAGVAVSGKVGEVSLDDWRFIMDVNLYGVVHGCHTFAPRFAAQGRGFILNVASAAGLLSPPEMGPYNVTKAGVVALSETLRAELAPSNVYVSVLCPTFFRTNLLDTSRGPAHHAEQGLALMDRAKMTPSDVARAALESLESNQLYAVPMMDGRAMWRFKRLLPAAYAGVLAWLVKTDRLPS